MSVVAKMHLIPHTVNACHVRQIMVKQCNCVEGGLCYTACDSCSACDDHTAPRGLVHNLVLSV